MPEKKVKIFTCTCGKTLMSALDFSRIQIELRDQGLDVEIKDVLCDEPGMELLAGSLQEGFDRFILAACTPQKIEMKLQNYLRSKRLDPHSFDVVNIREQCAWVHDDINSATNKVIALVKASFRKEQIASAIDRKEFNLSKEIIVIGGGIAGLQAAIDLSSLGFNTKILEKSSEVGGQVKNISRTFPTGRVGKEIISEKIKLIQERNIQIMTDCKINWISGHLGNFQINCMKDGKETTLECAALVIATGHEVYRPFDMKQYKYAEIPGIMTLDELSNKLADEDYCTDELKSPLTGKPVRNLFFIQCIGSRDTSRFNYCSEYCCMSAINHAIELKEAMPDLDVKISYFDIRTPYEEELKYTQARSLGIDFIRGRVGSVEARDHSLTVSVFDTHLGKHFKLPADMIVLSTPLCPVSDNNNLFQMLNLNFTSDGFLKDYYSKLRQVETNRKGIFICGTVSGPKTISKSVAEAHAVALRVNQLFQDGRFEKDLTITKIDLETCNGCGLCVRVCPFNIPVLIEEDEEKAYAMIDELQCKGCGICASLCPTGAAQLQSYQRDQILIQIEELLSDASPNNPLIIGFVCDECAYATVDSVGILRKKYPTNIRLIRLPCLGRLSLLDIFKAYEEGAGGVLLLGCAEDRCHYLEGNTKIGYEVEIAKEIFKAIGLDPDTLEYIPLFSAEPDKFLEAVNRMAMKLKSV